jgi:membrane-associated protein
MEHILYFADLFIHIDKYLNVVIIQYGALSYLILFSIIFCETGLVVTPFLPGDSFVFAAGALAATGSLKLIYLFIIFCIAAIAGDTANYEIGRIFGKKLEHNENQRFIKKIYIERTQGFFKKYGACTIIISRFIPIVRTFAPFVAGIGFMSYKKFISYNIVGGISWISIFLFGGFFFGNLPFVNNNFGVVIIAIIFLSILPAAITYIKNRYLVTKSEQK